MVSYLFFRINYWSPLHKDPTNQMGKHRTKQWDVIRTRTDLEDIGAPAVPGAHSPPPQQLPESVRPHPTPATTKELEPAAEFPRGGVGVVLLSREAF